METQMDTKAKQQLTEISTVATKDRKFADALVVKSDTDMQTATTFLVEVKKRLKSIKEWKSEWVKPLDDHVKKIKASVKEVEAPLLEMEKHVKGLMSEYTIEENRKRQAEEDRLRKLREKREERAKENGKPIDPTPMPIVERKAPTTQSEEGSVTTSKTWRGRVVDEKAVPRQYLTVDQVAINTAVRSGVREIKGVEIYEDIDVSVSVK